MLLPFTANIFTVGFIFYHLPQKQLPPVFCHRRKSTAQYDFTAYRQKALPATYFLPFTVWKILYHCITVPFRYRLKNRYRGVPRILGSAYLQSMDFQREPQSKHHLYFLDCFFFTSWPTRPNPTHIANANPTPTPADRMVPIHSWRPLGHSTVWADFVCVSGSVLYLVRT